MPSPFGYTLQDLNEQLEDVNANLAICALNSNTEADLEQYVALIKRRNALALELIAAQSEPVEQEHKQMDPSPINVPDAALEPQNTLSPFSYPYAPLPPQTPAPDDLDALSKRIQSIPRSRTPNDFMADPLFPKTTLALGAFIAFIVVCSVPFVGLPIGLCILAGIACIAGSALLGFGLGKLITHARAYHHNATTSTPAKPLHHTKFNSSYLRMSEFIDNRQDSALEAKIPPPTSTHHTAAIFAIPAANNTSTPSHPIDSQSSIEQQNNRP